jgi:predicted TIM-barrel fold metal-dependent hydrolase
MKNGFIDIVSNLFTPEAVRTGVTGLDENFKEQVRMDPAVRGGIGVEAYIEKMDRAGIERSLLPAVRCGDMNVKGSYAMPYKMVADVCQKYPERFSGLAGVDPTLGVHGLKELDAAVKNDGFVGAHFYPHWFAMPPDAALMYPYYARCVELDIPIMMQVGQNLVYSKGRRLPSVAKPILLDRVAIDFPTLSLIGIHIGVPWTDEMIAMCWKHENIFTAGDAYAPKHWPKSYVHYANTYGREKVMWGSDWPVIDPERGVKEVAELNFRPEAHKLLMRDNALRVFKKIPR